MIYTEYEPSKRTTAEMAAAIKEKTADLNRLVSEAMRDHQLEVTYETLESRNFIGGFTLITLRPRITKEL